VATLAPDPATLGLGSPVVGPWFSKDILLGAPNDDLSVTVALDDGVDWFPPATGTFSVLVASAPRPLSLAHLRQASGASAFTTGRLVGLFRLLAPVEERLDALMSVLPSADPGATAGVPTRSRVRYVALELPDDPPTLGTLINRLSPGFPNKPDGTSMTQEEKAEHVGLKLSGETLTNGPTPMSDLKRPGFPGGVGEKLLGFPTDTTARLWAFDTAGRAIDPGAVAAWWSFLATSFQNLFVEGQVARTARAQARLTVHLVNPHEGALDPVLDGRLAFLNLDGSGPLREAAAAGNVQLSFDPADPDNPDDAPLPRMALLPNGRYASELTLWPAGPVGTPTITRDFVRVAVTDVEAHLVGQRRATTALADTPAARRAADQDRASTRVPVSRTVGPLFRDTADAAADAAVALFASADPTRLVTSVLSRDWGGLDALTLPDVDPPDSLPDLTVSALVGGGTAQGGTVAGQRALLDLQLGASLAGAWVRAWTQGFDPDQGRHVRLDGGAGVVRADGRVTMVADLADGDVSPNAPMGADVEIVTARATRLYMDQRFLRPAPVGGQPLSIGQVNGQIILCEIGQVFGAGLPNDSVPPGVTLAAPDDGPALIDRSSLAAAVFRGDTLVRGLAAGDAVALTEPAFIREPDGDSVALLSATGATVEQIERGGLLPASQPGAPLPTMERLEIAAATVGAGGARGVVASTPAFSRFHELLPHQAGHPGAPAATEIHGTGVALDGPAAVDLAELVRDRVFRTTADLVVAAATPFVRPVDPPGPTPLVAVLRTVAAGVEGEQPALAQLAFGNDPFFFEKTAQEIRDRLIAEGITPPAALDQAVDSIVRALDRRVLVAGRGARDGATSLVAALGRAEDFVYIETPAFDVRAFGGVDDQLQLWPTLVQRMLDRPALRVLMCLPIRLLPGTPDALSRVRDALLREAVGALLFANPSIPFRIQAFAPSAGPGRTLRFASTTVIVDDAYALTGTTHLWRRGLSFDSSVAVAVFDETVERGRPAEIRRFRRRLIAGRLGLSPTLVPDDPGELIDAITLLGTRGGGSRLATAVIEPPDPEPSTVDIDAWNRDGSPRDDFNAVGWLAELTADAAGQNARTEIEASVRP